MSAITTIQSVSDMEAVANEWDAKFFNPGLGYPLIWYRGQSEDLPPLPGVLRPNFLSSCDTDDLKTKPTGQRLWDKERTINRQFRRMSTSLVPAGTSSVSLYLLAQHHGFPTRLMDWSMNPLAALYFSVSDYLEKDGVVYVMNANSLTQPVEMRDPKVEAVIRSTFDDGEVPQGPEIIPLLPDLYAGRMLQQSSCFTLHAPPTWLNILDLDITQEGKYSINPSEIPGVVKHLIPKEAKPKIRLTLRRLGVTGATLFPDLDHVASEIKNAWRL
jgi:hypothetical protein